MLPLTRTAPQLSPITRAALWILLSGICSVMMNVLIRVAAQEMHPFEVAFFRCLFGLLFVLPWIVRGGAAQQRPRRSDIYGRPRIRLTLARPGADIPRPTPGRGFWF